MYPSFTPLILLPGVPAAIILGCLHAHDIFYCLSTKKMLCVHPIPPLSSSWMRPCHSRRCTGVEVCLVGRVSAWNQVISALCKESTLENCFLVLRKGHSIDWNFADAPIFVAGEGGTFLLLSLPPTSLLHLFALVFLRGWVGDIDGHGFHVLLTATLHTSMSFSPRVGLVGIRIEYHHNTSGLTHCCTPSASPCTASW